MLLRIIMYTNLATSWTPNPYKPEQKKVVETLPSELDHTQYLTV